LSGGKVSSRIPILKQISIVSIAIQVLLFVILGAVFYQIDNRYYFIYAIVVFYILFLLLRFGIPRAHIKGVSLYKKGKYEEAIPYFEKSYEFFDKNKWIDKFRFVTMLSSSNISYREMALLNKAFCLAQTGKKKDAITAYKNVLVLFPDSKMAVSALSMLEK
jgi:tetratricopeptide (TPR) repeat protein